MSGSTTPSPLSLSARVHNLHPSPIREILAVAGRPGMISFAGGLPAPDTFPRMSPSVAPETLQYGPTEGDPGLRARIAGELQEGKAFATADDVKVLKEAQAKIVADFSALQAVLGTTDGDQTTRNPATGGNGRIKPDC